MACPGGCIGGGGQPRSKDKEILQKRQGALYRCGWGAGLGWWCGLLVWKGCSQG